MSEKKLNDTVKRLVEEFGYADTVGFQPLVPHIKVKVLEKEFKTKDLIGVCITWDHLNNYFEIAIAFFYSWDYQNPYSNPKTYKTPGNFFKNLRSIEEGFAFLSLTS